MRKSAATSRLLSLLLIASILPLAPLAYASPIDPSFPAGFYDNGDFDDVIDIITSSVAATAHANPVARQIRVVIAMLPEGDSPYAPATVLAPRQSRAPPLA